jgi:hypothetical protein
MPHTNTLLNLEGISQRGLGFRFDLLDKDETLIGEITPFRDASTPVITHDTSRTVMRDMTNLNLSPSDSAAVNPLTERVRPVMVLEDGSEWPFGVFLFADATSAGYSWGNSLNATLVDKGLIIDQPLDHSVSLTPTNDVRAVIVALIEETGVEAIVDTPAVFDGEVMNWPAGTSRAQVITDIGIVIGFMPPWFDHNGVCHVHRTIAPAEMDPVVSYEDGLNIFNASIVRTNDMLHATNRWIVISSDTNNVPVVGIYDSPSGLPFSFHARGFRVVEVLNIQGLGSESQANEAARTYALSQPGGLSENFVEHVTFTGAPDPRHDGYSVIKFAHEHWLEEFWSLTMAPGGPMVHTLRRVITDE